MTSAVPVPRLADHRRGTAHRCDVALIGFQELGSLGMGYLAAVLEADGYSVELLDQREETSVLVARVQTLQPTVVGFSLIFQYFLPEFAEAAQALRQAGVRTHFTIGGHFPSLCPEELLRAMPQIDSVVLFEGEHTLRDLVASLRSGENWRQVPGLALRCGSRVVATEPRRLIEDLDSLPFPTRAHESGKVLGWKYDAMLASRGCARRCSFCSIHVFYRTALGRVVRIRRPERVVEEMSDLADRRGTSIVLFQDDDFPLYGRTGRRWVTELAERMDAAGLVGKVIWKISCRADYVEPGLFAMLRDAGLYLVYLGLESGDDESLAVLNKRISRGTNTQAVRVLKEIGVPFAYGFMLFDPATTFGSLRANVEFLREIVGDGSAAAVFCRMMPYGGTPIRDQLRSEGRLRGDATDPDYAFLDSRIDRLHARLDASAGGWIHGRGVSHQLDWAWHEVHVLERLVSRLDGLDAYRRSLLDLTRDSNELLLDHVLEVTDAFESGDEEAGRPEETRQVQERIITDLLLIRDRFVLRNQDRLLQELEARDELSGPVLLPQIH